MSEESGGHSNPGSACEPRRCTTNWQFAAQIVTTAGILFLLLIKSIQSNVDHRERHAVNQRVSTSLNKVPLKRHFCDEHFEPPRYFFFLKGLLGPALLPAALVSVSGLSLWLFKFSSSVCFQRNISCHPFPIHWPPWVTGFPGHVKNGCFSNPPWRLSCTSLRRCFGEILRSSTSYQAMRLPDSKTPPKENAFPVTVILSCPTRPILLCATPPHLPCMDSLCSPAVSCCGH